MNRIHFMIAADFSAATLFEKHTYPTANICISENISEKFGRISENRGFGKISEKSCFSACNTKKNRLPEFFRKSEKASVYAGF